MRRGSKWRSSVTMNPDIGVSTGNSVNRLACLDKLPFEIREQIAQECNQSDAYHLCLVCRSLYESSVARLYTCIVFDSGHRTINRPTGGRCKNTGENEYSAYSIVKTVGGLRRCLRTLGSDSNKAALVKRLETRNSLEISDLDVKTRFSKVFNNLVNLRVLVWLGTPEITIDLLEHCLPASTNLTRLNLHIALRQNSISEQITRFCFPNIEYLILQPFRSSQYLSWLGQFMASSYTNTMRDNLKMLFLGQQMPQDQQVGSAFIFASMETDNYKIDNREVKPLNAFFDPIVAKATQEKLEFPLFRSITHLGLNGFIASASDARNLCKVIDLNTVTHLCLVGADKGGESMQFEDPGFLRTLAPYLNNVTQLELNWENDDPSPSEYLLSHLTNLECLKINIASFGVNLQQPSLQAIVQIPRLRKLTVHAVKNDVRIGMDPRWLSSLAGCSYLECLKLPGSSIPLWIWELDRLKILILSRPRHTLLLSDFLPKQRDVLHTFRPTLSYVKIEKHIFQADRQHFVIKKGLDDWLESQVFRPWQI